MKLEGYKSGMYTRVDDYRAFILSKINYDWSWEDPKMNKLLSKASRELGEMNAYFKWMPNIDTYVKMYKLAEAYFSMKIDGTNVTAQDSLLSFKEVPDDKVNDVEKMQNYVKAMLVRRRDNKRDKKA